MRLVLLMLIAAVGAGSQREAVSHYNTLEPHFDTLAPELRAPLLEEWAVTLHYEDDAYSIEVLERAISIYRELGDTEPLARALTFAGRLYHLDATGSAPPDDVVDEAIALLGDEPSPGLADAFAQKAFLGMARANPGQAVEFADRAIPCLMT